MSSGRECLLEAARTLLADHPDREPSTREILEVAGVAAPTLYHHFGTKDGLLDVVADEAFAAYLHAKNAAPRTGDFAADFTAGWHAHVDFGVRHPAAYRRMFVGSHGARSVTAERVDAELRRGLTRFADCGLLRVGLDEAVALTMGMATGCVLRLLHDGRPATSPVVQTMRDALLVTLTGRPAQCERPSLAARVLMTQLDSTADILTTAERGLLHQWLRTLADHYDPSDAGVDDRTQGVDT